MRQICLKCGAAAQQGLCGSCRPVTDIEELCGRVIAYRPNKADNPQPNPLWDSLGAELEKGSYFSDYATTLAGLLPSPRREYWQLVSLAGAYCNVPAAKREPFRRLYRSVIGSQGLTKKEKGLLMGLQLETLYMEYRYAEADRLAYDLAAIGKLPWQAAYNLADFYSKTRRYDEADDIIDRAQRDPALSAAGRIKLAKLTDTNVKYRLNSESGKAEYIPNPKEDKDLARRRYKEFLSSLGIEADVHSVTPKPIPKEEYPAPVIISTPNFNSFVAYDVETTGLSAERDCMIEIGAVKVVNGRVSEAAQFRFGEFIRPFKRTLSDDIVRLTHITKADVAHARPMWEVIPDFMKFVGDLPLVGYNNAAFDSAFLARGGRYSHIIIRNPQFDAMRYYRSKRPGAPYKLEDAARTLGISNPAAHRAWADALTTAKLYLKLKELN